MSVSRFRYLVCWGIVVLLSAAILSACDLGPVPTPTATLPPPPSPTVLPTVPAPPPTATPTAKPQPTNTAVPTSLPEPTATATPAPTQPPAPTKVTFKYAAPKLKEPKNGDGYGGQLLWEAVTTTLAADEYYHIAVHSVHNNELRHWGFDTAPGQKEHRDYHLGEKECKYYLPREQFGDKENNWKTLSDSGWFTWEIQVMRKLASGESVPISPPSELRSFFWLRSSD